MRARVSTFARVRMCTRDCNARGPMCMCTHVCVLARVRGAQTWRADEARGRGARTRRADEARGRV